jgi:hypothetical protein
MFFVLFQKSPQWNYIPLNSFALVGKRITKKKKKELSQGRQSQSRDLNSVLPE